MTEPSDSEQADLDPVQSAVTQLGELFDTVQIFVTRHEAGEEDGTVNINLGAGNYFARSGQVREWIVKQDERLREQIRSDLDAP